MLEVGAMKNAALLTILLATRLLVTLLVVIMLLPMVNLAVVKAVASESASARRDARQAPNATASQAPASATAPTATPAKHAITIEFDYDFSRTPVCTPKLTSKCVSEFDFYDISSGAGKAYKLTSIPAPAGATGMVHGISATTPPRVFESGKHLIAVTAMDAKGVESNRNVATVWVVIP